MKQRKPDFSNLYFKIKEDSSGNVMREDPSIAAHAQLAEPDGWDRNVKGFPWSNVLRFIFYAYDQASPFVSIPSRAEALEQSAKYAGINVLHPDWERVRNSDHVREAIKYFFRMQNNNDFIWAITAQEYFDTAMDMIRKPVEGDLTEDKVIKANETKVKLLKELSDVKKMLNDWYSTMNKKTNNVMEHFTKEVGVHMGPEHFIPK